jgi:DNA-binding NtrC family response regulator
MTLIDHNIDWLEFAKQELETAEYDVCIAKDVNEAFRLNSFDEFDLVFIGLDQIEALQEHIELTDQRKLPKRFIVTFPIRRTLDKVRIAFKAGAHDCVDKPFDKDSMLGLVSEQLDHSRSPEKPIKGIDLSFKFNTQK